MKIDIAKRYAAALFELTIESNSSEKILELLRKLETVFSSNVINNFLNSPLNHPDEKEKVIAETFKKLGVNNFLMDFIKLLAKKNRIYGFSDIVFEYQNLLDKKNNINRGNVLSPSSLGPEQRKKIEEIVSKSTGKSVIMSYKEDPSIIGGLIAKVGSYTFDDTITTHLKRMKEEINRSTI